MRLRTYVCVFCVLVAHPGRRSVCSVGRGRIAVENAYGDPGTDNGVASRPLVMALYRLQNKFLSFNNFEMRYIKLTFDP